MIDPATLIAAAQKVRETYDREAEAGVAHEQIIEMNELDKKVAAMDAQMNAMRQQMIG